jgi:uncharacterized protein YbjT (DUF2867 family)
MIGSEQGKKIAVVGATGGVGRAVADQLDAQGHDVRRVSRRNGVSFDDAPALAAALSDADGAFLMIPFDRGAEDLHRKEDEIGAKLAEAVRAAGMRRVVLLSGTSARLGEQAGSALGAARMEARLQAQAIPELVFLRGAFLMENLLQGVGQIAESGTFAWAFRADRAMPMVAAADIGRRAATLLGQPEFRAPRIQEVLGPCDYTLAEATQILGASVGSHARYAQIPYDQARSGMIGAGMSESFADAVMETARGFNEGPAWAQEERSPRNTTETSLEQFAAEQFAPAYRTAMSSRSTASAV